MVDMPELDLGELEKLLLLCRVVKDDDTRERFRNNLNAKQDPRLSDINLSGGNKTIANRIASFLIDYPDCFQTLLKLIEETEGKSNGYNQLKDYQKKVESKTRQRNNIEILVERLNGIGISTDTQKIAYQLSLHATTANAEDELTLQLMVENLSKNWNTWKPNEDEKQIPPLLEFVLRLTHKQINSNLELVGMVEEIMGIDAGNLSAVAKRFIKFLNTEDWPDYYILVDIDQILQEPPKYNIAIYSGKRVDRVGQARYDFKPRKIDAVYYTEGEVKNAFMKMLDDEIAEEKQLPDLIEFVLPIDMMYLGIDEWAKELEKELSQGDPFLATELEINLPIGRKYPVVLRPQIKIPDEPKYEEIRQIFWGNLKRRWQAYQSSRQATPSFCYFENLPEPKTILATLDVEENKDVTCIIIGFPIGLQHSKSLAVLMRQGIPIVLWSRQPSSDLKNNLNRVFQRNSSPLPCLIHEERKNAALKQSNSHIGASISLLWNDAVRAAEFEAKVKAKSPRDGNQRVAS